MAQRKIFLTAEWRHLVMLNYEIDPRLLDEFVPRGTELDDWHGRHYVSMVGFRFLNTRLLGMPIPFHQNFEEVNLRFYVRHKSAEGWRRGVVFIKELVPRAAIAFVARTIYNEPYLSLPMASDIKESDGVVRSASYSWRFASREHSITLATRGVAQELKPNSEAEFITEHYWGYNKQRDGTTLEYQVEHPRWRVYEASHSAFDCDINRLYGKKFSRCLSAEPASAFLAEGSAVTVRQGNRL